MAIEELFRRVRNMEPQGRASGWIPFTDIYETGFEDHSAGEVSRGYRRVGDHIEIEVHCKRSSGTGTTVATLPAAYRPEKNLWFATPENVVSVGSDGTITVESVSPTWTRIALVLRYFSPLQRR